MGEMRIMRYSKIKIKEIIFKELQGAGFTITDIYEPGGYFIFKDTKNSIFHFSIKEIPYWKFGLWIHDKKSEKCYLVDLFGEKVDWIDKFKPGRCSLDTEIRVKYYSNHQDYDEYYEPGWVVTNLLDKLNHLKTDRLITEYSLGSTPESFLKWYWNEFKYYNIQKPITDWWENKGVVPFLKVISWWIGFKYRKYLKCRPFKDTQTPGWKTWPRWEVGIEYLDDCEEDDAKRIYFELEDSKLVHFIDHNNARFQQYWDNEDKKGFYYSESERQK